MKFFYSGSEGEIDDADDPHFEVELNGFDLSEFFENCSAENWHSPYIKN